jgi:hypothetical protein
MSKYSDRLSEMARGCEYYADAYAGTDAPFPERMPTRDELCHRLQEMSRLAHAVLTEYEQMQNAIRLYGNPPNETSFSGGTSAEAHLLAGILLPGG